MRAKELYEFKLVKHGGGNFRIWKNPSASDIRAIIKNTWIANNVPEFDPEVDDEADFLRGHIHGLDYPLRGVVIDNNVYIVDSYYANHDTLVDALETWVEEGIPTVNWLFLVIQKQKEVISSTRDDPKDYKIGMGRHDLSKAINIPALTRMNLPIEAWN